MWMTFRRGRATRQGTCEACGCIYEYTFSRIGFGSGSGWGGIMRSSGAAESDLEGALEKGVAMAACPECGHFQGDMIRACRWFWIKWVMAWSVITPGLHFLAGDIRDNDNGRLAAIETWNGIRTGILGVGVGLIILGLLRAVVVDPNRVPALRMLHRRRATPRRAGRPTAGREAAANVRTESMPPTASRREAANGDEWIVATCPHCGKRYKVPAAQRGREGRCRQCGKALRI